MRIRPKAQPVRRSDAAWPESTHNAPPAFFPHRPPNQLVVDRRVFGGRPGALHPLHGDGEHQCRTRLSGGFADLALRQLPAVDRSLQSPNLWRRGAPWSAAQSIAAVDPVDDADAYGGGGWRG